MVVTVGPDDAIYEPRYSRARMTADFRIGMAAGAVIMTVVVAMTVVALMPVVVVVVVMATWATGTLVPAHAPALLSAT